MPRNLPSRDPIHAQQRKAIATRRLGENAKCTKCGEARPEALNTNTNPLVCENCHRRKKKTKSVDAHHIAGRANSPITTTILANDHRAVLSVAQQDWPKRTLRNPDGCPLLKGAAHIRGFVDTVAYYMEAFLLWVAELLEAVSADLEKKRGRRWWIKTELKRFGVQENSRNE
jgi:hypothetical protein